MLQDAPICRQVSDDKKLVVKNIADLAKNATDLVLWLDGDREGEAICFEVMRAAAMGRNNLRIHRARFSANTKEEITNAMHTLVRPNLSQAEVSTLMTFS